MATPDDRRAALRRRVLMRAAMRVRGSGEIFAITVKDISSTGLKASTAVAMFPGTLLEIELPNIGWVAGEVQRIDGQGSVSVQFGAIIDPDQTQPRVTGSYGPAPTGTNPQLRRV